MASRHFVTVLPGGNHTTVKKVVELGDDDTVKKYILKENSVAELFQKEVQMLRLLGKSGITPLILGTHDLTFRMEVLNVGDLMDNIEELTQNDRHDIGLQLCTAVTVLHDTFCIVHQDLKPENIGLHLVEGKFVVKLIDFEVAKQMDTLFDKSFKLEGTASYYSFEKFTERPFSLVPAELWTLTLVLFILTFGIPPYPMFYGDPLFHGDLTIRSSILTVFNEKAYFWRRIRTQLSDCGRPIGKDKADFFDVLFQRAHDAPRSASEITEMFRALIF
jgi:serine/threonine protein kinase